MVDTDRALYIESPMPDVPINRRLLLSGLALLAGAGLAGCTMPRELRTPLETLVLPAAPGQRADTLIVFLPGSMEVPLDIVQQGFVAQVRERQIGADVVVVDSHIGYFRRMVIIDRLREDVIGPARAQGYRQIWLAGISLGGYGALLYAMLHPQDIAGVIAIAPFVAPTALLDEVNAAGGLARWRAPDPKTASQSRDMGRRLLAWLQRYGQDAGLPVLYMGYGDSDRLQPGPPLMAGILPEPQVLRAPGGHDWPPWRQIWGEALDRALLPSSARAAAPR